MNIGTGIAIASICGSVASILIFGKEDPVTLAIMIAILIGGFLTTIVTSDTSDTSEQ